jgi:hypothetical protein
LRDQTPRNRFATSQRKIWKLKNHKRRMKRLNDIYNTAEKRRKNYKKLRSAGFNSKQANRFKNMRTDKVEKLIETQQECKKKIEEVLSR